MSEPKWSDIVAAPNPGDRIAVIFKAGREREIAAVPFLIQALDDRSEYPTCMGAALSDRWEVVAGAAAVALGRIGCREAAERIRLMADSDENEDVRYSATIALAELGLLSLDDVKARWGRTHFFYLGTCAAISDKEEGRKHLLEVFQDPSVDFNLKWTIVDLLLVLGVKTRKRWFRNEFMIMEHPKPEDE